MQPIESEISVKVFISYAHEDQELRRKLEDHLSALTYSGAVSIWQDQEIPPGADWENQINSRLNEADIILLLISSSFMASNYCWSKEVQTALERHKAGTVRVIPIILKPTLWQGTPLGKLQALPTKAKAITQWNDQDAAFEDVARGIQRVVEKLKLSSLPETLHPKRSRRTIVLGLVGAIAVVTAGSVWVAEVASIPHPNMIANKNTGMKGKWVTTGSILQGRYSFRATTLKNGKVLIEGGNNTDGQFLAESELFNTSAGTWTKTGRLNVARCEHTATLLQDGSVLVVGGYAGPVLSSAELYDPLRGTWTPADSLNEKRTRHTATLLKDGKVLVAGGWGRYGIPINSAEIYDPNAGSWSSAGTMGTTRSDHVAVLLEDGKVLVAGGAPENDTQTAMCELYDPTTNTWIPTGSLNIPRRYLTAVLLPNGKVLAIGGETPTGPTATAELYNPVTTGGHWTLTGGMKQPRTGLLDGNALLFADGRVLVAGGDSSSTSEIYMLGQGIWTALANIGQIHDGGTIALLNDGRALIVGGRNASSLALSAAIYSPD